MNYLWTMFDNYHANEQQTLVDATQCLPHRRRRDARASVNINWAPSGPWKVHDGLNLGAQSRSRWLTSTIAKLCVFLAIFSYPRCNAFSARGTFPFQSFVNKMHPFRLSCYFDDFPLEKIMIITKRHALRHRRR